MGRRRGKLEMDVQLASNSHPFRRDKEGKMGGFTESRKGQRVKADANGHFSSGRQGIRHLLRVQGS